MEFHGAIKLNAGKLEQVIKKQFHTSDYFLLSAIREAQGMMKSNIETHRIRIITYQMKIQQMEMKLETLQRELDEVMKCKEANKTKKLTEKEY